MKPLPLVLILVVSLVGGRFIGLELAANAEDKEAQIAHEEAQRAAATELAEEKADDLWAAHFQALQERMNERSAAADEARAKALEDGQVKVERMAEIMTRSEDTLASLSDSLNLNMSPGELLATRLVIRTRADDLRFGKLLIGAEEQSNRRRGIRHLTLAAAEGSTEAVELLMSLFNDPDQTIAQEALRSASGLARSDDAERKALFAKSGLEDRLVSMLGGLDGNDERRVLQALTELRNPAASQAWRQVFNDVDVRGRDQVTAARALKELGSDVEYDQLVGEFARDLTSDDRRAFRSALSDLRRLGGEPAKAALQRALDADPQGENADTLRQTIERFDRQYRQGRRTEFSAPGMTGPDPTRRVRSR